MQMQMSIHPELCAQQQAHLLEWMVDHPEAVRADSVPRRPQYGDPSRLSVAIFVAIHLGVGLLLARALVRVVVRLVRPSPQQRLAVRRWEVYSGRTAVREPRAASAEASDHARVPARA